MPTVGCTWIVVVCPIMMLSSPPFAIASVVNVTVICEVVISVSVRAVISPAGALILGVCELLNWKPLGAFRIKVTFGWLAVISPSICSPIVIAPRLA